MALNPAFYSTRSLSFIMLAAFAGLALWLFAPWGGGQGDGPAPAGGRHTRGESRAEAGRGRAKWAGAGQAERAGVGRLAGEGNNLRAAGGMGDEQAMEAEQMEVGAGTGSGSV